MEANVPDRFDRLPHTPEDRCVEGRPTRRAVTDFFKRRYGIQRDVFREFTFWEKGAGRVWVFGGEMASPQSVEALGLPLVRVRQPHWKPTTVGAQRFGHAATQNVSIVDDGVAKRFLRGEDQSIGWDGEWGFLMVAQRLGDEVSVLGVGLYVYGELRSMIPKGRRRDLD